MFNIFNSVAFSVFSLRIFVSAHVIVTSITALDVFTNPLWLVLLLYVFFFSSFFFSIVLTVAVFVLKKGS